MFPEGLGIEQATQQLEIAINSQKWLIAIALLGLAAYFFIKGKPQN